MAIKNSVSNEFLSSFVFSINIIVCRLSGVVLLIGVLYLFACCVTLHDFTICHLLTRVFFFNFTFFKTYFWKSITASKLSLDPSQGLHVVWSEVGLNCLQSFSR